MKEIEYWDAVDKSQWGEGPWQQEPDKAIWQDKETGLTCMMVRGPFGGLCGYVGVPPWHPLFGRGYGECPVGCAEPWCEHTAEMRLQVHGGVTFSNHCHEPTPERWEQFRKRFGVAIGEMRRFPYGDSARFVKEWKDIIHDYEQWKAHYEASSICHPREPGEPEAWWFGFDCAHCDDLSPMTYETMQGVRQAISIRDNGIYRTFEYVKGECAQLAQQLAGVAPLPPLALPAPA
jgi:hypothetical protein